MPVTVTDKSGNLVLDLSQGDFQIFDGGEKQTIDHWELGGNPLAVALVLETSSHLAPMAQTIHRMGSVFTETVMALDGIATVITCDSTIEIAQPFTQDHTAVEKSISGVKFEVPEMRLHDGMAKAIELLKAEPRDLRRVMLVVGESQDTHSDVKLATVLREAALADVAIYAIGPSSTRSDLRYSRDGLKDMKPTKSGPSVSVDPPQPDRLGRQYYDYLTPAIWLLTRGTNELSNHQLEIAAAATGGEHFRALRDSTILAALERIGSELHAQYVMSYSPATDRPAGFSTIRVDVSRRNLTVRARPGYYVTDSR